jgi:tungstate transport system ATP-binding protein
MRFEIKGLTRSFQDHEALDDVNLEVPEGKILAIVGPSGSGKTTLLRLLNLLDRPSEGKVLIDGKNPWKMSKRERMLASRRMAMVFQNPVLLKRSVLSNVVYGLAVRGVKKSKCKELALEALDLVGLKDRWDQFAPTLSAGEGQRMAFARAAVVRPNAILLDEFTANLDPGNVDLLENDVKKFNKETGGTVILATHNLYQAKRISHRTAFLFDGKIVEEGFTEKVFGKPKKTLTKRFLSGELAW